MGIGQLIYCIYVQWERAYRFIHAIRGQFIQYQNIRKMKCCSNSFTHSLLHYLAHLVVGLGRVCFAVYPSKFSHPLSPSSSLSIFDSLLPIHTLPLSSPLSLFRHISVCLLPPTLSLLSHLSLPLYIRVSLTNTHFSPLLSLNPYIYISVLPTHTLSSSLSLFLSLYIYMSLSLTHTHTPSLTLSNLSLFLSLSLSLPLHVVPYRA